MMLNFAPHKPWTVQTIGDVRCAVAGYFDDLPSFLSMLQKADLEGIKRHLRAQNLCFGLMIEGPDLAFAALDRIRSFPVFYHKDFSVFGNHAPSLASDLQTHVHLDNLTQFAMAGYVLGDQTLHNDVLALQTSQLLYATSQARVIEDYYLYAPRPQPISEQDALQSLDHALDEAIKAVIDKASGAPVWVPLSGGLDSRLVLAKLHQHGCPNLQTFSYGLSGNFEAQTAKKIAKILNVPWCMVATRPKKARALYLSDERKAYEAFSHNYACIPSYVEYEAIQRLKHDHIATPESFIINGQTGDFISGGHVPDILYSKENPTQDDVLNYIVEKHFSLWLSLKTPKNVDTLKSRIRALLLPDDAALSIRDNLMRAYECFEWRERQGKVVVQSQRIYDFFGYRWLLPLWDSRVMDFFETLPFDKKQKQRFFKTYLKSYNYKGVFDVPVAQARNWAPHQFWIVAIANALKILHSDDAKKAFYKRMLYYGHSHHQYALFGKASYNIHAVDIRNMISLSVRDFCESHSLKFPCS